MDKGTPDTSVDKPFVIKMAREIQNRGELPPAELVDAILEELEPKWQEYLALQCDETGQPTYYGQLRLINTQNFWFSSIREGVAEVCGVDEDSF